MAQSRPALNAAGQAVGVLADDKVALLEPENPLRLHAECADAEVGAAVQERLPDVQAVAGWHVQLVAELAGEPDPPQHAVIDTGDLAGAHVHVGKGLVGQVHVLGDPLDQIAGLRPATFMLA